MKRITRNRRLTPEEAAKYNAVRAQVERDKPEIDADIRRQIAKKRRQAAAERNDRSLGQRIREARETLGRSQVEIAGAAGISQGYLSQLEQDEREPTLSVAARLASALDVSLDELAASTRP